MPELKPYMGFVDIAAISEIIKVYQPMRCLEWGAGYSTLYFSKFQPEGGEWHAIEHDGKYYRAVIDLHPTENITVYFEEPDKPFEPPDDGTYEQFESYVNRPAKIGGLFDFILVDGRARVACVEKARDLLAPNGIIILHDAERAEYLPAREIMADYKCAVLQAEYTLITGPIVTDLAIWRKDSEVPIRAIMHQTDVRQVERA